MILSYQYQHDFLGTTVHEPQMSRSYAAAPEPIPLHSITNNTVTDPHALSLTVLQASTGTVQNTFDVALMIQRIRRMEKQIELYVTQLDEATSFYKHEISRAEICIEVIKRSIQGYFQQRGLRNMKTPSGTAFVKTYTQKQWPDTDALVAWAHANVPSAVRTKYEPDKRLLSEHIKKTGEVPDGYFEESNSKIYIK